MAAVTRGRCVNEQVAKRRMIPTTICTANDSELQHQTEHNDNAVVLPLAIS